MTERIEREMNRFASTVSYAVSIEVPLDMITSSDVL